MRLSVGNVRGISIRVKAMIMIGRPIEGISINGLEYALDDKGEPLLFENEKEARDFLLSHGMNEKDLEYFVFVSEEDYDMD